MNDIQWLGVRWVSLVALCMVMMIGFPELASVTLGVCVLCILWLLLAYLRQLEAEDTNEFIGS